VRIRVKIIVLVYANGEFMYGARPHVLSTMVRQRLPCLGMRRRWLPHEQRRCIIPGTRGGTPTSGRGHFADRPCRREVRSTQELTWFMGWNRPGRRPTLDVITLSIHTWTLSAPVSFLVLKFLTYNYYY
jgi:hypothetical protein